MSSKGLHHITAVAGDPQENLAFYTGILGLRLLKKTINFDDPSVYHLYYGDGIGSPGSILTFFPWSRLQQGQPYRGQAIAISFAVPDGSLSFWEDYLDNHNIEYVDPFTRFGRKLMGFQDPDGLHLEIVEYPAQADTTETEAAETNGTDTKATGRANSPIPPEHAIRGIHGITLAEEQYEPTGRLLTEHLGFKEAGREHDRILYTTGSAIGSTVEVIDGAELDGRPGRGTVHHVAFRAKDEQEQQELAEKLTDRGYHLTEKKDRIYFQSVYFYEPGGILFEIATDGPGFTVDESRDSLGSSLQLPPWLEDKRSLIETDLPDLSV